MVFNEDVEVKTKFMKTNLADNTQQKLGQFLECVIPNFIGLYVNSYVGVGLSVILLLWHWQHDNQEKRPQKPLLLSLIGMALLLLINSGNRVGISPIVPPCSIQSLNYPCPLHLHKRK